MKDAKDKKQTNIFDFLTNVLNFILNLFKLEKVACLVIVYLIIRDRIILSKVGESKDISELLIDTKIISEILTNDNELIILLGFIIIILLTALIIMCVVVIPVYKKEIDRLSEERSELMHGKYRQIITKHNSSNLVREE